MQLIKPSANGKTAKEVYQALSNGVQTKEAQKLEPPPVHRHCQLEHVQQLHELNRSGCCLFFFCKPYCILVVVLALFLVVLLVPFSPHSRGASQRHQRLRGVHAPIDNKCNIRIVESIPLGLNYTPDSPKFMSTYDAWQRLLDLANVSLDMGTFYWTMRGSDVVEHPSAAPGEEVFQRLLRNANAVSKLGIRIAQSVPKPSEPDEDTALLARYGAAQVRNVDFPRLLPNGGGVLHTKLWIVDNKHFYLGSANMDWRALTQVKELGVLAENCACLTRDLGKIFNAYWFLGTNTSKIPRSWPFEYWTHYNWAAPMVVEFNNNFTMSTHFSSAPPPLSARGRQDDVDAIVKIIGGAKRFVNIAVMDYLPLLVYQRPMRYWPVIDDAIRTAAVENRVSIKLLISWWSHSNAAEDYFLHSLSSLSSVFAGVDIEIRRFVVPTFKDQERIPYARVNHNKYMVTDNTAYIGTSNWSGDYFTDTAGIGLVMRDLAASAGETLRNDLLAVFERDWASAYAMPLRKHTT